MGTFEDSFDKAMAAVTQGTSKDTATDTKWLTRKKMVQAGEYDVSKKEVTEHYTADGWFSILPSGSMIHKRSHGYRGQVGNRWSWQGYNLSDNRAGIERWENLSRRYSTVRQAKRAVEWAYRKTPAP